MKTLTKSLLGVGAAAAALVSVAPAQAQYRDRDRYRDNDGISAGEIIAGAVVLGGLAAVISAGNNDRYDDRYDRRGYDSYNYNRNGGSRAAINRCVNQVENWASRYSRSEVTQIRDIDRTRYGYRVQGNLVVQDGWRGGARYIAIATTATIDMAITAMAITAVTTVAVSPAISNAAGLSTSTIAASISGAKP